MDGGATDSSCPSHRVHHSSSELKLHILFQFEGHVILLPQDTTKLLNILPLPPSNLADIVRVVWVGKPVQDIDRLRDYFSVQIHRVYDTLVWMTQNNEDYKKLRSIIPTS